MAFPLALAAVKINRSISLSESGSLLELTDLLEWDLVVYNLLMYQFAASAGIPTTIVIARKSQRSIAIHLRKMVASSPWICFSLAQT
jgi:hypothetical protein